MYLLVDLAVVLLLFFAVWRGIKKGFFQTSYGIIGSLLVIAFSVALSAIIVLIVYKLGAIDGLKFAIVKVIGETNGLFEKLNVTSEQVAYYIALGLIAIVAFIISYPIMLLAHKKFLEFTDNCRDNIVFRVADSTVGVIVNTALCVGVILGAFAIINAFASSGMLNGCDEVLRACPISNIIYEKNPLNEILLNTNIAQTIANALN